MARGDGGGVTYDQTSDAFARRPLVAVTKPDDLEPIPLGEMAARLPSIRDGKTD